MSLPYSLPRSGLRTTRWRPSPWFLAFLGVAVLGGVLAWSLDFGDRTGRFGVFLLVLGGWVVSLCLHEFAHAFVAFRAGDRDVEAAGYLTLNPFKYAHPVLSILLPLLFIVQGGIGLPGGAVYLHPHRFARRWMQSLAAAVGPLTNLVLAAVLLLLAKPHLVTGSAHLQFWTGLAFLGFLQTTAAVLNLLPIPGLDGYSIVEPYLDPRTRHYGDLVKPWGLLGIIVLFQIDALNNAFYRLVAAIDDLTGIPRAGAYLGQQLFRFWTASPF